MGAAIGLQVQPRQRRQPVPRAHQVQGAFHVMGAIQSRRMFRRYAGAGEIARGDRRDIRRRRGGAAKAVQHRHGRQAGQPRQFARRRAGRQRQQAFEHVHVQTGQRQRRPVGACRDVEHDVPAGADALRGDQRRAIRQPRPDSIVEFGRGLGQHLAGDRDFAGNLQTIEGRVGAEIGQVLRLSPGHGTAQVAPADAQPHRHQVVGSTGHAFAGEADQHAALGDEVLHPRHVGLRDLRHVSQHQHRDMLVQQRADRTLGDFRIGAERAFQVIDVGQQRLVFARGGFRHDAGAALGRALVQQLGGAGAVLAHHRQPRGGVAHFHRQRDMTFGRRFAALEVQPRRCQRFAAHADGGGFRVLRRCGDGAGGGDGKAGCVARHRQHAHRQALGREHGGAAITLEGIAQGLAAGFHAVAQPVQCRRLRELETPQRVRRGLAVAGPGHGLQFLGDAAGFAFIQQSGRSGARGGNDRHRATLCAMQQVGDQFLPFLPAACRAPAIVHHQHQRSGRAELGPVAQQRIGQRHNKKCRRQQTQQQQPPGRGGRCLFFVFQTAQQLQRRKHRAARQRRGDAQQPPQQRQHQQPRQYQRRSEAQHHAPPMAACSAIRARCGE